MAGDTQENDVHNLPQGDDEDAAMLLGFNTAMGDTSAVESGGSNADAPKPQAEDDAEARARHDAEQAERARLEAEAAAAAQAEAERNAPVTLTRAQLDDLTAKLARVDVLEQELTTTRDKLNGKVGNVQQSMQQALDAVRAQVNTGRQMSAVQLAKVREVYPDLAELLEQDLGSATTTAPDTTGTAPAPAAGDENASGAQPGAESAPDPLQDPRVRERLEKAEKQAQAAHQVAVSVRHPDWKDVAKTPEFTLWRSQLTPEAQATLANTWDSAELIPALDAFKDWKAKRDDASKQRDKRLEDAMPATSGQATGAHAPQDEDALLMAGFKAARGQR